ncbi:hypothetical protein KI809_17525 [Geobacter pelophilus]|uniref:DUF4382 domain-containing protein n=1 Tax=Geoanaerobacter pelophilus TaxID=60036 RepID=A0AAW4LG16_9BACT|nr:hypothetical protein [Geoanaerobacter pelophilus]MBT0666116.1 hypothetical protein [Geoanaerobacter pelophilus]
MKNYILLVIFSSVFALTLAGCGGGGGGGGTTTQAVTTLYLFGQMSSVSNSKIANAMTTINVPDGVLVNYSSPAPIGLPPNTYEMRTGFASPSGTVLLSPSDITGSYNTVNRKLTVTIVNSAFLPLRSYTSARGAATVKGAEVAKVYFRLDPPGGTPILPIQDPIATIYQYRDADPVMRLLMGSRVNFDTKFQ